MISIFVNATAGDGKALKVVALMKKILTELEISLQVYINNWPDDLIELKEVWIVGGDGTINYFLNKYQNINIPLAFFKGGTGNDFAWMLYGDISIQHQIELVLQATAKPVDAAVCNGKIFVNVIGIGFDGEVLKSMSTIRWMGGHIGYLWVVVKKIFSFREQYFNITIGDKRIEGKFLLVSFANASREGGGFLVAPDALINDGKLNMMLCKQLSVFKRLRYLPVIEKGKHLSLPFIQHQLIDEVSITCSQPIAAQFDGELIFADSFHIKALPSYVMFKY